MSGSYLHNRHSVTGGGFHFQFTPKYRQPVFEDRVIRDHTKNAFEQIAERMGITLNRVEFGPDHAHLFVTDVKNYSESMLAGRLKGASSRLIRRNLWDRVKLYEWGDSFWSDGYFSEAVGNMTQDTIQYYITRQQRKHWVRPILKTQRHTRLTQHTLSDFN